MRRARFHALGVSAIVLVLTGCAGTTAQSVNPVAEPARASAAGAAAELQFARDMIEHHAQALAMTALVPGRAAAAPVRLLAERLEVSQRDEIAQLRGWLSRRGEGSTGDTADPASHHDHGSMPGMRTAEQLARLEAARGAEFDRLFLEHMIAHHEGALVMIRDLFAAPGAGQDPEIFRFASEIEADQRMEITRMQQLLAAMPDGTD
ncbi:MAG TPA: DUF305 domain-containing protein [Gemmatimonadaceae bacterium]